MCMSSEQCGGFKLNNYSSIIDSIQTTSMVSRKWNTVRPSKTKYWFVVYCSWPIITAQSYTTSCNAITTSTQLNGTESYSIWYWEAKKILRQLLLLSFLDGWGGEVQSLTVWFSWIVFSFFNSIMVYHQQKGEHYQSAMYVSESLWDKVDLPWSTLLFKSQKGEHCFEFWVSTSY